MMERTMAKKRRRPMTSTISTAASRKRSVARRSKRKSPNQRRPMQWSLSQPRKLKRLKVTNFERQT